MHIYRNIVRNVLENGKRQENRTGIATLAVPNVEFRHNMVDGFPLLTTKKLAFRSTRVELEGFIGGITSKKWYAERKCNIWKQWANPEAVKKLVFPDDPAFMRDMITLNEDVRKEYQEKCDDLGPIYGYQWRRFSIPYMYEHDMVPGDQAMEGPVRVKQNPHNEPYDQLTTIVRKLKIDPNDRRLVCSAWNPMQIHQMALPPCHTEFVVTAVDGRISLHWTQRSCDLMLGVPFNIASYATLLLLLAKDSGLKPYKLTGMLCNCHIYENQIDAAREQVGRTPKKLPTVEILDNKEQGDKPFSLFAWEHDDVKVKDYNPHPKIDFGEVAV